MPGRRFTLFILPNSVGHSRLGMSLSRKVGNSVVRNQARRRLREVFRMTRSLRESGLDIVIQAKPAIVRRPLSLLKADLLKGISRFMQEEKGKK